MTARKDPDGARDGAVVRNLSIALSIALSMRLVPTGLELEVENITRAAAMRRDHHGGLVRPYVATRSNQRPGELRLLAADPLGLTEPGQLRE